MEYRNYIFDFYGTLCDIHTDESKPVLWKKTAEVYSAYGALYGWKELRSAYHRIIDADIERHPGNPDYEPDVTKVFEQLYLEKGVKLSEYEIRSTAVFFRALSRKYIRLYPGVEELLNVLKERNKRIYLLSNAQTDFTRPEITMLGIGHFFDGIFISSEQGVKKPGKLFFERLLETYSVDPAESIMIGNDESADIAGAKAVGMDSLYIHSNISPKEYGNIEPTYKVLDGDFYKIKKLILD